MESSQRLVTSGLGERDAQADAWRMEDGGWRLAEMDDGTAEVRPETRDQKKPESGPWEEASRVKY
ncbi:hypothetical protein THARTR1_07434 [Trichoderma harzianum]|uniref:Uncharacterized protein n=1 Tax=Trichoderma harzianum TaxID=5544 RepID=A0A2K0U374_TRIHA|nr:hypothetical protein THARTR1_07434 [Trichoderma harzianum]